MICDRIVEGPKAQALASKPQPFGPALEAANWVSHVEVWYTEDHEGVDFTEFRVFDGSVRRKTVQVAGY